jgi:hypothetical protein
MQKVRLQWHTLLTKSSPVERKRLILLLLLPLPVLIMALVVLRSYFAESTATLCREKSSQAALAAATVEENLNLRMELGKSYATNPLVSHFIEDFNWYGAGLIVSDIVERNIGIDRVLLYDTNCIIQMNYPELNVIGQSRASWKWYQEFIKIRAPYISGVYQRGAKPKKNITCLAFPVFKNKIQSDSVHNSVEQQFIGILQFHLDLNLFHSWTTADVGNGGIICIVDKYGNIIHHPYYEKPDSIINFSDNMIVQAVQSGKNGASQYFNTREHRQELAGYHQIKGYGWGVIVTQPSFEVFKLRNRTLALLIVICLIILCGTVVLIGSVIHSIAIQQQASDEIQRTNNDLHNANTNLNEALESIKTLKGMLPICSYCKKIRNDTGYWQQIESYVKEHSDADFSHSICPSCVKLHFPDIADDILGKSGTNNQ